MVVFLSSIAPYICLVILKNESVMKAVVKNLTVAAVLLVSAMGLANGTATDFGKKASAKNEV